MPLVGTFSTMSLPELLQWLGEARRSGSLTLIDGLRERCVKLDHGAVVALGSVDSEPSVLIDVLVSRGAIQRTALTPELIASPSVSQLRAALVDGGVLGAEDINDAIGGYARDVVMEFFLAEEGRFVFVGPDEGGASESIHWDLRLVEPLAIRGLLMDGVRRMDEWSRMRDVFPHDNVVVHALKSAPDLPAVAALAHSPVPITIGDLSLRLGVPTFRIVEQLHEGLERGLVAVEQGTADVGPGGGRAFVASFLRAAEALFAADQFEEAGALVRRVRELDPLDSAAAALWKQVRTKHIAELYRQMPASATPTRTSTKAIESKLSREERYVLYRVDGEWDTATLVGSSSLGELQTLRVLGQLVRRGLVRCG